MLFCIVGERRRETRAGLGGERGATVGKALSGSGDGEFERALVTMIFFFCAQEVESLAFTIRALEVQNAKSNVVCDAHCTC
jgi:hypothetical protein